MEECNTYEVRLNADTKNNAVLEDLQVNAMLLIRKGGILLD